MHMDSMDVQQYMQPPIVASSKADDGSSKLRAYLPHHAMQLALCMSGAFRALLPCVRWCSCKHLRDSGRRSRLRLSCRGISRRARSAWRASGELSVTSWHRGRPHLM